MGQNNESTHGMLRISKMWCFPFNPDAIDCSFSIFNSEASLQLVNLTVNDNGECQQIIEASSSISSEKLLLYQQRLEERHDLPHQEYMEWLSANHPETFAEKFSGNGEMDSVPLSDLFGDIPVASPVAVLDSEDNTRNISADNAGNELSNKTEIDLAQGDPSDKGGHDSVDER